ncbi:MAG: hypothetical protein QUV04_02745 [Synechococcus sp. WH 8007]|nr:hypothetical protein [Synechococcus sp. WH 8007]
MPASSTLTEQLATLGVHLPPWPEEPEGDESDNWIQQGQAYAEGMRLWRAQLQTAIEIQGPDVRRLVNNMQGFGEMRAFTRSAILYLLASLNSRNIYERTHAAARLLARDNLSSAEQLGVALELTRSGFTRLGVQRFKKITELYDPSEIQRLELCVLLVENLLTERDSQDPSGSEDPERWQQSLDLCIKATSVLASAIKQSLDKHDQAELLEQLEALSKTAAGDTSKSWNRWESVSSEASNCLLKGHAQEALNTVRNWTLNRCDIAPKGVDEKTYADLLLNTCSFGDHRQPLRWLVESRSLPRSGHHFLKGILKHAWGDNFSYCEGYQEPGCCKGSPCTVSTYWHFARRYKRPHVRLLKSHDFALTDATFDPLPGMVRLIQVRQPFDLLVSWMELAQLTLNESLLVDASISLKRIYLYHEPELLEEAWMLVDEAGAVMNKDQARKWLTEKSRYVVDFLQKWLPLADPFAPCNGYLSGNVVLRYEDLGSCHQLLKAMGRNDLLAMQLPAFAPRHQQVMKRRSARVSELIQDNSALLLQASSNIMTEVPEIQALYAH